MEEERNRQKRRGEERNLNFSACQVGRDRLSTSPLLEMEWEGKSGIRGGGGKEEEEVIWL